jgi:hypothetical protein
MISPTDLGLITIVNVGDTIYGFSGAANQVVTLNLANGQTSFVSDTDPALGLIAGATPAVPEPASIAVSAMGLIALGSCCDENATGRLAGRARQTSSGKIWMAVSRGRHLRRFRRNGRPSIESPSDQVRSEEGRAPVATLAHARKRGA